MTSLNNRMPSINNKDRTCRPSKVPFRKHSKFCQHNDPTKHQTYMTDDKRLSVSQIKKREEIRATKNRLRGVLIQKLCNKYRKINKSVIAHHVNDFVSSRMQITSEDLINLERAIQGLPNNLEKNKNSSDNGIDDNGQSSKKVQIHDDVDPESVDICEKIGADIPKGIEWNALTVLNILKLDEKEQKEQEERRKQKQLTKMFLDLQMEEARLRRQELAREETNYALHVKTQTALFEKEKADKIAEIHAYQSRERAIFEKQREEERRHKQEELVKRQAAEQLELQRIAEGLEQEQRIRQMRKEEEARKHQAILLENAENEKRRALARQKEKEENELIMKQNAERIENELRAREAAFQKRIATLEKFTKWADEEGPGKAQREEELKFETMLLKEQLKREEKERKREIDEAAERARKLKNINTENLRQIEEKHKQLEAEKEADREYARKRLEDAEKYKAERAESHANLKGKQARIRSALLSQINTKKDELEEMNENERKLNSDAIKTIVFDPHFHSRVFHRLRISGARPSTAPDYTRAQRPF